MQLMNPDDPRGLRTTTRGEFVTSFDEHPIGGQYVIDES